MRKTCRALLGPSVSYTVTRSRSIALGQIIVVTDGLFVPLRIEHPVGIELFLLLTAITYSLVGSIIDSWAT